MTCCCGDSCEPTAEWLATHCGGCGDEIPAGTGYCSEQCREYDEWERTRGRSS